MYHSILMGQIHIRVVIHEEILEGIFIGALSHPSSGQIQIFAALIFEPRSLQVSYARVGSNPHHLTV